MIIERAEIPLKASLSATDVDTLVANAKTVLGAAPGCHGVRAGIGVESPSKLLLLLMWDTVDHHIDFTKSAAFAAFRSLLGAAVDGPPAMEHFREL